MLVFNLNYRLIYTEDIPENFGALCEYSRLPLFGKCTIKIRPKYKEDKGLLEHELEHVRQFSINPFHAFMYKFIHSYRYKCELNAYIKQVSLYNYTNITQLYWVADALLIKYNLRVTKSAILSDLANLPNKGE